MSYCLIKVTEKMCDVPSKATDVKPSEYKETQAQEKTQTHF